MRKSAEELAREVLYKHFRIDPGNWTDQHTCFLLGYMAALNHIPDVGKLVSARCLVEKTPTDNDEE